MDNSFDKFNEDFNVKKASGFKVIFFVCLGYFFGILGIGISVYALFPDNNQYFSLITLLLCLFGTQAVYKARGGGDWRKMTLIPMIVNVAGLALSCFILYILPYFA